MVKSDFAECSPGSTTLNDCRERTLIVAPSFRHYGHQIRRAFVNRGWNAVLHEQHMDLPTLSALRVWRSGRLQENVLHQTLLTETKSIMRIATQLNPSLVLVMNGEMVHKKELSVLRKYGTKLALWCYDSISTHPRILDDISTFDHVFVFEPTDLPILSGLGIESSILQMAYDPTIYLPVPNAEKRFDLTFVGTLFAYPARLKFLKKVASMNRGLRIGIFTNTPPIFSPKRAYGLLAPFNPFLRIVDMRSRTHSQINEIYNSSRICLNSHHEQSREGLNPRTFEIMGSGAFQLVDEKRQLSDVFDLGEEVVCYYSDDDLHEKIRYFLDNPSERDEIAGRGEKRVHSRHTYEHRIEQLLQTLSL